MSLFLRRGLTHQDFIEICETINHWEWDERMGEKPEGFNEMTGDQLYQTLKPYLKELQKLVSEYDRLRHWNCEAKDPENRMTYEEFDTFYERMMVKDTLESQNHSDCSRDKSEDRDDQNCKVKTVLFSIFAFSLGILLEFFLKRC